MGLDFVELKDLDLNKAGYLVIKKTGKPVKHDEFVKQQKAAEYVVKLAEAIKNANFKVGKVDNLEEIKRKVREAIDAKATKEYVAMPKKPVSKANEELVQFALDFAKFEDDKIHVSKINELMAQFDVIDAVESVGDYFSEGLCKLNDIYDTKTILAAVKINAEKLK